MLRAHALLGTDGHCRLRRATRCAECVGISHQPARTIIARASTSNCRRSVERLGPLNSASTDTRNASALICPDPVDNEKAILSLRYRARRNSDVRISCCPSTRWNVAADRKSAAVALLSSVLARPKIITVFTQANRCSHVDSSPVALPAAIRLVPLRCRRRGFLWALTFDKATSLIEAAHFLQSLSNMRADQLSITGSYRHCTTPHRPDPKGHQPFWE